MTNSEQRFMRRLSVFAGGWTMDAAQLVYECEDLELIGALVRKSVIVVNQEARHETRYHFHNMIRKYALENSWRQAKKIRFVIATWNTFLNCPEKLSLRYAELTNCYGLSVCSLSATTSVQLYNGLPKRMFRLACIYQEDYKPFGRVMICRKKTAGCLWFRQSPLPKNYCCC